MVRHVPERTTDMYDDKSVLTDVEQISYDSRSRTLSLCHKKSTGDIVVLRQRITRQQNDRSSQEPTARILVCYEDGHLLHLEVS